jgi:hypothetical protein
MLNFNHGRLIPKVPLAILVIITPNNTLLTKQGSAHKWPGLNSTATGMASMPMLKLAERHFRWVQQALDTLALKTQAVFKSENKLAIVGQVIELHIGQEKALSPARIAL